MTEDEEESRSGRAKRKGRLFFWLGVLIILSSLPATLVSVITLAVWVQERGLGVFGLVGSLGLLASSMGWFLGGLALVKGIRLGWLWLLSPILAFIVVVLLTAIFDIPLDV